MDPPRKRARTAVCPCPLCNGRERDYRTIESHMSSFYEHSSPPDPSTAAPDNLWLWSDSDELDLTDEGDSLSISLVNRKTFTHL